MSVCLTLSACAPALDWRDVRPEGSGLLLLLPCKAVPQARRVQLAGAQLKLSLLACRAAGQTWALAFGDVVEPARVTPALAELWASAAANVGAKPGQRVTLKVPGATPHPEAGQMQLEGRLPDGQRVDVQVAVFVLGTRVFQATALGPALPREAVETFFGSLRASP